MEEVSRAWNWNQIDSRSLRTAQVYPFLLKITEFYQDNFLRRSRMKDTWKDLDENCFVSPAVINSHQKGQVKELSLGSKYM